MRHHRAARTPRLVTAVAAMALVATVAATAGTAGARALPASRGRAGLDHVFVIVLENYKAEDVTPAAAPYLASLARQGVTLDAMYGVDHASLTNYIAMTSGNTPNAKTQADCLQYDCIFEPPTDHNLGDQLEARHGTWKAYLQSMPAPCTHPTRSGALDPYLVGYATRHNPFVYYRDVIGPDISRVSARCAAHDVPYPQLATDLATGRTPNYSLIVPDTCDDGHDRGPDCSLPTADRWLAANVPAILATKDFRHHGALIVTFDESEGSDRRGCCGNSSGGKIATVVVSPFVTRAGSHSTTPYNHYSVLRTIESVFGLGCLGHACDPAIHPFGRDVWTIKGKHPHS
jgi:phospholipase C